MEPTGEVNTGVAWGSPGILEHLSWERGGYSAKSTHSKKSQTDKEADRLSLVKKRHAHPGRDVFINLQVQLDKPGELSIESRCKWQSGKAAISQHVLEVNPMPKLQI